MFQKFRGWPQINIRKMVNKMAINLTKGQKIDLTKTNPGLTQLQVGLGWDPIKPKKKGLFGALTSVVGNLDCDASVLMLVEDHLISSSDIVSFRKLKSDCGSVIHSGDNLTGSGNGDDETIMVHLNKVPSQINRLVFVVNIFSAASRRQDFGMVENAYIRVINPQTKEELVRFNLTEDFAGKTSLITGEIYRHNGEWKFNAIGNGTSDTSIEQLATRYR